MVGGFGQVVGAGGVGKVGEGRVLTRFVDEARGREVPVALYGLGFESNERAKEMGGKVEKVKLAVISHGYGVGHTEYGFVAESLVAMGYAVVSVQHQLPGDAPLPSNGEPKVVRRPSWEQGAQNILFVAEELGRRYPWLETGRLLLVGHSHGGDASVLLATERPERVRALISFDSRRMPFPRHGRVPILTLRSSDQVADAGVLPEAEEQKRLGMRVVQLPATRHNDMVDEASAEQRSEMAAHLRAFVAGLQ